MPSTAEAAVTSSDISGLFDHAFRAFGESCKVAMKAQEDSIKFWSDAVGKINPMHAVTAELIPTAKKHTDEYLRLMETSCRRNADLVKKVIHNQQGGDGAGLEKRTRDWWEASMEAARDNAQDLASTNLRVAQAWSEVFKKGAQQSAHVAQKAATAK